MAGSTEEEITKIKSNFAGRCRIVKGDNLNGFRQSITLQPKDMDVTIKFQIKDDYPATVPVISIRSSSLADEDTVDLVNDLKLKAMTLLQKQMLHELMAGAESWLNERCLGRGTKVKKQTNSHKKNKSKKNKRAPEDEVETKQPSMKTSEDVIKRIQWDSDLPEEEFLVGYIDRFLGIQEKYFSAFSWDDISTVDYNVLAIPQHRIQYFKYKELKVWDKNEKLDNVFGSLGSGKTISDVMKNYKPPEVLPQKNVSNTDDNSETPPDDDANGDSNDSDSDDDGIVVTLDTTAVNTVNRPYLDHLSKRPTHFIALRLENTDTVQRLVDIQARIKAQQPELEIGFMPSTCFHVTLCTLGLDHADQVREACQVLKMCQSELSMLRPSGSLELTGIDNFYNRTVFSKIKYPKEFLNFVEYLKLGFINAGIEIRDSYGFVPHITVLKVSKQTSRNLGAKFLISDLYPEFKDAVLGSQYIDKISLCIMGDARQEDGFWVSLQDIELN